MNLDDFLEFIQAEYVAELREGCRVEAEGPWKCPVGIARWVDVPPGW